MTSNENPSSIARLRVAIVGAGPAGIYAGNLLAAAVRDAEGPLRERGVAIDLLETLPAPYGLIRYGVAPDHPRIKGIVASLHEMLDAVADAGDRRTIRFLGNVEIGRDVSLEELQERYDAVIIATGAIRDAALDVPGVDLAGSFGAADFVAWYDGHPDVPRDWTLDEAAVAVIGNGNVALDVARMLAKHAIDLTPTEIPDNVLAGLEASAVTDVHVFGRRGPADIKFTPIELRELGEVRDVDIVLDDADFAGIDDVVPATNQLKVMLRILDGWRSREVGQASRRLHLHFWHAPVEVLGEDGVRSVRFERTTPTGDGAVLGTGEFVEYPVGQVYRAVGYYGTPVVGVPFDEVRGVVPNVEGRVTDVEVTPEAGGMAIRGLYATGWIKRGPVGLIGHTKSDAMETIAHLIADATGDLLAAPSVDADITELLEERGVEYTTWDGWIALDAHERALGVAHRYPRERVKVVPRDEQVEVARG